MSSAGRTRTPRPFGRQRKPVDEDKLAALLDKGVTWVDAAKILGCSVATIARRLRDPSPPPLAAHGPALAPPPTPDAPLDAEGRRRAALQALDRALQSDDGRAVQAAREVLAESRREAQAATYADLLSAQAATAVALAAARLGAILRRRAETDVELAALLRASASTSATPEQREALASWIDARPEVMREVTDVAA